MFVVNKMFVEFFVVNKFLLLINVVINMFVVNLSVLFIYSSYGQLTKYDYRN